MTRTKIPLRLRASILWGSALLLCGGAMSLQAQELSGVPAVETVAPRASRPSVGDKARSRSALSRTVRQRQLKVRTRAGDTWASLAERFNVSADEVARLNGTASNAELRPGQEILVPSQSSTASRAAAAKPAPADAPVVLAEKRLHHESPAHLRLADGSVIEADEVWEDEQGVRYRRGGVVYLVERARVSSIERGPRLAQTERSGEAQADRGEKQVAKLVEVSASGGERTIQPVWIYLVGGARVERIEREQPVIASDTDRARPWKERGWSTGNGKIDMLIRQHGARYGVDPYLIFCVMEQESHFNPRVVSPKGARGLMQLMPGTGARFGVRRPFDPAENIMGGTRYLKQLLEQFGGRVDLVLAGYNAGEGAVMKYGGRVPPYKETRDYVKRISKRYGQNKAPAAARDNASGIVAEASRLR